MKYISLLCVFLCTVFLCSCTVQREMNTEEFIKKVNAGEEILPPAESFKAYRDGEYLRYSRVMEKHLMLNLYSQSDGKIQRITLVTDKPDEEYRKLRPLLLSAFTDKSVNECKKLIAEAEKSVNIFFDIYCISVINCDIGETFLISRSADEINTNEYPTLKKHIDDRDISRPTAGNDNTSENK